MTDPERRSPTFRKELTAPEADVDGLGHVSNVAIVRWVQDVAVAHSDVVGWDWPAYVRLGAVFVVRRHVIDYLAPIYGGEQVVLETWIEGWRSASTERRTRILRAVDAKVLTEATTLWAMVGSDGGRPRRIPPELKAAFAAAG